MNKLIAELLKRHPSYYIELSYDPEGPAPERWRCEIGEGGMEGAGQIAISFGRSLIAAVKTGVARAEEEEDV